MTWTTEKIQRIPELYRDFLLTLRPVVRTRRGNPILKTYGVSFGTICDLLAQVHDIGSNQVQELARNLQEKHLVITDKHDFYAPTPEGEELIVALSEAANSQTVPPFPDF